MAYSSLKNLEITLHLARVALQGVLGSRAQERVSRLTPKKIQEVVATQWGVDTPGLASKRRTKNLTVPRQVAMFLMRELLDLPLIRIGSHFGGRDHSTVIHSIRKVEETMADDPTFERRVAALREELAQIL